MDPWENSKIEFSVQKLITKFSFPIDDLWLHAY